MKLNYRITLATLFVASSIIAGCASGPAKKVVQKPQIEEPPSTTASPIKTIDEWLDVAQQADIAGDVLSRDRALLGAVQQYLSTGDIAAAQQILWHIRDDISHPLRTQFHLALVSSYLADPSVARSQLIELLQPLSQIATERDQQLTLLTQLHLQRFEWFDAAQAASQISRQSAQTVAQIWHWVNQIELQELDEQPFIHPLLRPYLELAQLLQEYGFEANKLSSALNTFKQQYATQPLIEYWPLNQELAAVQPAQVPNELVILLPLSGRLAATGQAVKQGLLAGYFAALQDADPTQPAPMLSFVDTVATSEDALQAKLLNAPYVIGPLLKENVALVAQYLPSATPWLALNRLDLANELTAPNASELIDNRTSGDIIDEVQTKPRSPRVFFALAPEDEAAQLAERVFFQGYRAPIIISSEQPIYQRMQAAFMATWQQLNQQTVRPEVSLTKVDFSDSGSLRDGITSALDVAQSEDRIKQIEALTSEQVYNVPRNRRDTDAIVVFASPQETELLNPMVEASLSPVNQRVVPVYATSRSLDYDSGKNTWRDLQNVHFLEIPWLLPNNQWSQLWQQSQTAWPERSTQLQRLFAFGVDAYSLVPRLGAMQSISSLKVHGLTGELKLNQVGEVVRTLPLAVINDEAIIWPSKRAD